MAREVRPVSQVLHYGRSEIDVPADTLLPVRRGVPAPLVSDPVVAIRAALEAPLRFPPLRRALTPDDAVAVVVDESLPDLGRLLTPLLEHILSAGVAPAAITLLTPPSGTGQPWVEDLPESLEDVRIEVHDPSDRKKLAYLATTQTGERIYLNRTLVDAAQVVVLSRVDVDPRHGRGGAGLLYPILANAEARRAMVQRLAEDPSLDPEDLRDEAEEIAWLLGAPFLVQVIEGEGDGIAHIVAGPVESTGEAVRLYEERWAVHASCLASTVVATVCGVPKTQDFARLARALDHAAAFVEPDGRVILLTEAQPRLDGSARWIQGYEDPGLAREALARQEEPDLAAFQWLRAVQHARVTLLSGLSEEEAESLFVVPLEEARQVRRLIASGGPCLILEDADRVLPAPPSEEAE